MFRAYFYKGTRPGMAGIYNRLVRARGDGKYSHVELSFGRVKGGDQTVEWAASSSFEDKGTRFKAIDFSDTNWDYIDLPEEWSDAAYMFMANAARNNKGYDLKGNIHIALGFISNSKDKFFCSEAIAAALMLDEPFRFEPNALYVVIKRMVELYNAK